MAKLCAITSDLRRKRRTPRYADHAWWYGVRQHGGHIKQSAALLRAANRMANDIDIGLLVSSAVKRVHLLIRLKSSSVYIRLSSAEEPSSGQASVLAGATLWRAVSGPVRISVPAGIHIASIDIDAGT